MKRRIISLFLALTLGLTIAGCGEKKTAKEEKKKDSISIYVGTSIFNTSLDPIKGAMSYGYSFTNCALIKVNPDSKYVGDLATDWNISEDALTYTFNLRKDIKFHDKSKFTADDVVFTFQKVKDNQGDNEKVDLSKLKSVEAVDDYTVKFTLTEAYSPFLDIIASLGIVPSDNYDSRDFDEKPIGTGAWKVVQYDTNQQIILEANDDYYDGKPNIKKVTIVNMDSEAAFSNAKSGQLDVVMVGTNYANEEVEGMTLENFETMDVRNMSFPCLEPQVVKNKDGKEVEVGNVVTSDIAVRKAISIGIDRDSIIERAFCNVGKKAVGFTDNLEWGGTIKYEDNQKEEAKKLLEEAGWKDEDGDGIREKDGVKCEFNVYTSSSDQSRYLLGTAVSEDVKELGINMVIKQESWDEIYKKTNTDCVLWGWGQYNPILIKQLYYSKEFLDAKTDNVVGYSNKEADKFIDDAVNANNHEIAIENWKKALDIVSQDYPYLFIVNIEHSYFINDSLDISKDTQIPHPHGHGAPIICNMKDWKIK